MAKLNFYQLTDRQSDESKTVLREGDKMIFYRESGLVRFSRDGRPLYGCMGDDKCIIGNNKSFMISVLHHFGIGVDLVAEKNDLIIYKLRQLSSFSTRSARKA